MLTAIRLTVYIVFSHNDTVVLVKSLLDFWSAFFGKICTTRMEKENDRKMA